MIQSQHTYFVGRQAELRHFAQLLSGEEPLRILNVHGHSGVGKTWLLGAFREACREGRAPFAQLDAYRLGDDLSPPALLTNLSAQLELSIPGGDDGALTFDRLLPQFITALAETGYPQVVLMVDDYDRLFHLVDPWLRNLFRAVRGIDQFIGPPSRLPDVPLDALPRILTVINSQSPVSAR